MTTCDLNKLTAFKMGFTRAKEIFNITPASKSEAYEFVRKYHYLKDAKFFAKHSYGLRMKESGEMVGVAAFSNPQGPAALKGWFSLPNQDQSVVELSRLCVIPELNGCNATSFLLGGAMRKLRKEHGIRAVITLADSSRHVGSIYQVCNFRYYGLTNQKTDFYGADGTVNRRGGNKDIRGVWIPRTQKHRYAYIMDESLVCNYAEKSRPTASDTVTTDCCYGFEVVYDKRFDTYYTCPKCTGELKELKELKAKED